MAFRKYKFLFARILVIGRPIDEGKAEFFRHIFSEKVIINDGEFRYVVLDVEEVIYNHELFFYGVLNKYKNVEDREVVNETEDDNAMSQVPRAVIAKSEFVIHSESGIITYKPVPNKLSHNQFRKKMAEIFETAFDKFFVSVRIESVEEDFTIVEEFERMSTIYSIYLDLHPVNPGYRDIWRTTSDPIDEMGANRLIESVENRDKGLNKENLRADEVYKGMLMAADGYGKATIHGKNPNGQDTTVSTSDNPAEQKIIMDGKSETIIEQVIQKIQEIFRRNHKDEN